MSAHTLVQAQVPVPGWDAYDDPTDPSVFETIAPVYCREACRRDVRAVIENGSARCERCGEGIICDGCGAEMFVEGAEDRPPGSWVVAWEHPDGADPCDCDCHREGGA